MRLAGWLAGGAIVAVAAVALAHRPVEVAQPQPDESAADAAERIYRETQDITADDGPPTSDAAWYVASQGCEPMREALGQDVNDLVQARIDAGASTPRFEIGDGWARFHPLGAPTVVLFQGKSACETAVRLAGDQP